MHRQALESKNNNINELTDQFIKEIFYSEYTRDAIRSLIDRGDEELETRIYALSAGTIRQRDLINNMNIYLKRYHKVHTEMHKYKEFFEHNADLPLIASGFLIVTYLTSLSPEQALLCIGSLYAYIMRDFGIADELEKELYGKTYEETTY